MSTFTRSISIVPLRSDLDGVIRMAPPVSWPATYEVGEAFEYHVGSLDCPEYVVRVLEGFRFDGASIPLFARFLLPRVHPQYLQAAAVHDWLYLYQTAHGRSRRWCDSVFLEAMQVLGTPLFWRRVMWAAVRVGGWRGWKKSKRMEFNNV